MEKAFKLSFSAIAKVSTLCLMFSAFSANATEVMASDVTGVSVAAIVQQNGKITGTVVDTKGEPVIGANVVEKGTTIGTITDMDGRFTLEVKPGVTLEISYIGYVTQTMQATKTMKISLKEDTQKLDEVVVVGYGTQQKKDITGSVAVVDTKDLLKTPSSSVTEQLQGRAAGVVIGSSGSPGTSAMGTGEERRYPAYSG